MNDIIEDSDEDQFANGQRIRDLRAKSDATKEFDPHVDLTTEPAKFEETHDELMVSDQVLAQRWSALDRLLRVSFGLISPAYLFTAFRRDR